MRIKLDGLHASRRAGQAGKETDGRPNVASAREAVSDDVTVSSGARMLALGRKALQAVPEVRRPVVEAARLRLTSDADAPDGRAIARAMIDTISTPDNTSEGAA